MESGNSLVSSCESGLDLTSHCCRLKSSILSHVFAEFLHSGVEACNVPVGRVEVELWRPRVHERRRHHLAHVASAAG